MGADHQDRLVGPFGEEPRAGRGRRLRVRVEDRRPIRMGHLAGMVGHVAGDHRALAARFDHHADVAGRVPGGRRQADLRRDAVVQLDQLGQARLEDRLDAVAEDRLLLLVALGAPVLELALADQVTGLGEGRDPLAVLEHGVPAHVVDVQVGADHHVDAIAAPAGVGEVLQEGRGQRAAARDAARPVVADARVDHQPQPRRLDQQCVDGKLQPVVLADEVRIEPGRLAQLGCRRLRQEDVRPRWHRQLHLHHPADLHPPHLPAQHACSSSFPATLGAGAAKRERELLNALASFAGCRPADGRRNEPRRSRRCAEVLQRFNVSAYLRDLRG